MGLDIYTRANGRTDIDYRGPHAGWSYGGFAMLRQMVAAEDGITLSDMRGFGGTVPWDTVTTELAPFLDHSDCDGELTPAECQQVLPRLSGIHAQWSLAGEDTEEAYRVHGLAQLIELLDYCVKNDTSAIFC